MDQSLLSTVLYAAVIFLLTVAAGYATETAQVSWICRWLTSRRGA